MRKTFKDLREGDRFYFENPQVVSLPQQREVKKMNMARVMCLPLRDAKLIHENLFDVFVPGRDQRI